jgi:HTH-type transcriptional regulator, competence development regulator
MTPNETDRKPETFGRRLAAARVILGLSQSEAAEKAGVSQAYLSQLENDKAVSGSINTVAKLAEVYGVTIDYLVNGSDVAA